MRSVKLILALTAASLSLTAVAQAAPVTIGSTLAGEIEAGTTGELSGTLANLALNEPGARVASPVSGVIVNWSVRDGAGPFKLRVLRPAGGGFLGAGSSAIALASGGIQTFPTALPIQAGDLIGLDVFPGNKIGVFRNSPADITAAWVPQVPEGVAQPFIASEPKIEVAFNAVVQPAPTLALIAPSSGPISGGTAITIAGTDFVGVNGVSFGGVPAASFSVLSEGQLTAVAPKVKKPGAVDVTVTTVAGTTPATATTKFTYKACVVPNLAGKSLKAAKKRIRKAGCKVGKVTLRKGITAKTGKVVGQGPKAGKTKKPGTKVNVTLG